MRLIRLFGLMSALFLTQIHAQTLPQETSSTKSAPNDDAQTNNQTESLLDNLESALPDVDVEQSPEDIVEEIPDHILKENNRYVTLSIENDFLAFNGIDRDYTNGFRLTYFNVGQDQPQVMNWVDQLIDAFEINKTTTTYYSVGQNLYTPHDITRPEYIDNDRPYGAFLYGSIGMGTIAGNSNNSVELTVGALGPIAMGKPVQTEFHRMLNMDLPVGWDNQLHNELGVMLSFERAFPNLHRLKVGDAVHANFSPHYGVTVGNVYTYANAGFSLDITPQSMPWQTKPVRVRPAMPGSGFFETPPSGQSWQVFAGVDTRFVLRNIFLDGNTFQDSHRVNKRPLVVDAAIGAAYTWQDIRMTYTYNWRSKEYYSPYSAVSQFGAMSFTYRF